MEAARDSLPKAPVADVVRAVVPCLRARWRREEVEAPADARPTRGLVAEEADLPMLGALGALEALEDVPPWSCSEELAVGVPRGGSMAAAAVGVEDELRRWEGDCSRQNSYRQVVVVAGQGESSGARGAEPQSGQGAKERASRRRAAAVEAALR